MSKHVLAFYSDQPQWELGNVTYHTDGSVESANVLNGGWHLKRSADGNMTIHEHSEGNARGMMTVENFSTKVIECDGEPFAAYFGGRYVLA